jgi:pimeloyl-ACP methyl ester carboxylesterase
MVAEAKAWAMRSGHARFLREAGFDVMVFDYNGFGESEDGRLEYPDDILAAGNAAKARMPGQPVILYGVSMGAGYGLCALDSSTHPYDAAVIESAFTSLEEFWRRFRVPYLVLRTLGWFLPRLAGQLRPIDRIGRITGLGGILFIYGSEDSLTPPSMGERLRAASRLPPERLDLWVVPGARHLKAFSAAGGEYPRRVLGFLDSVVGAA